MASIHHLEFKNVNFGQIILSESLSDSVYQMSNVKLQSFSPRYAEITIVNRDATQSALSK